MLSSWMLLLLLLLLLCGVSVEAANILFFYFPGYSHIRGSLHVASELASRGHVVWNAMPPNLAEDSRLISPGVKTLTYDSLNDIDIDKWFIDSLVEEFFENGRHPLQFKKFDKVKHISDLILTDKTLYEKMQSLKLDLLIFDIVPISRMLTVFAYKLDLPFIFMGAAFEPYASRTPFIPSAWPYPIMPWSPVMDFQTRLLNFIMVLSYWIYDPFSYTDPVAMYAPEKPPLAMEALTAKASLWLIEHEPLFSYPQALLPNVKLIGGLSISKPKPLPRTYLDFVEKAKYGVVVVSFGSNVKKIPQDIHQMFMEAFAKTKYKYIFRTDKELTVQNNILMSNWIPQSDLLAHPNTKLFITHCGQNGQNEAFIRGVPLISFPLFAEQHYNAEKIVHKGFGLKMNIRSFTSAELVDNIKEVMQNSSYARKIKRIAEIANLRDRSAKEEAVYWIKHVIQYGGDHLRSYSQDMPLYQYLCLDVLAVLLTLLHLFLFLIWKVGVACCRAVLPSLGKKKRKTE